LFPGNAYEQHLLQRAAAGDPVALTAPGVLEITYGLARKGASVATGLRWFTRLAVSELLVVTLPFDAAAAVVAGRLRAAQATPPTGARRGGSRAEQRAGWVLDLQIGACAWVHGHAIATHNRRDFAAIRDLIAALYPSTPPLAVTGPPDVA